MIALLAKVAEHCVGLEISDATKKIERAGASWRVVEKDGISFMIGAEYNNKRISVVLNGKKIVSAEVG